MEKSVPTAQPSGRGRGKHWRSFGFLLFSGLYGVALCHSLHVDLGSSVNLLWKYLDIHSQKDVSLNSSLMLNLTKSALKMNLS